MNASTAQRSRRAAVATHGYAALRAGPLRIIPWILKSMLGRLLAGLHAHVVHPKRHIHRGRHLPSVSFRPLVRRLSMHQARPLALESMSSPSIRRSLCLPRSNSGASRVCIVVSRVQPPAMACGGLPMALHRRCLRHVLRMRIAQRLAMEERLLLLSLQLRLPCRARRVEGDLVGAQHSALRDWAGEGAGNSVSWLRGASSGSAAVSWRLLEMLWPSGLSRRKRLPPHDPTHDGPLASLVLVDLILSRGRHAHGRAGLLWRRQVASILSVGRHPSLKIRSEILGRARARSQRSEAMSLSNSAAIDQLSLVL